MVDIGSGLAINLQRTFSPAVESAALHQLPDSQIGNFNVALDTYNVNNSFDVNRIYIIYHLLNVLEQDFFFS